MIDELDAHELIRRLSRRGKLQEIVAAFAGLKPKSSKSWRRAFRELVPLAGGMLSHLAVNADSDAVRLAANDKILLYAGERPSEKLEHTGKDGGPIETKTDLSGLNTEELRQLRTLMQKARRAGAE